MNDSVLLCFIESYSLPTLIIAAIIAVITLLTDKLLTDKICVTVKSYVPFALGILFYCIYDLIFVTKKFAFDYGVISAGLLCGSISVAIFAAVKRMISGSGLQGGEVILVIEGILCRYITGPFLSAAAKAVENILKDDAKKGTDDAELIRKIAGIIKEYSDENRTNSDCESAAKLIITALNNLKNGSKKNEKGD